MLFLALLCITYILGEMNAQIVTVEREVLKANFFSELEQTVVQNRMLLDSLVLFSVWYVIMSWEEFEVVREDLLY